MLKQVTNMGIFPRFWSEKKTLKPPIVQFLWLWIHYTLIDSFLLHCVPLSMESISIFSPSSIGGSPLSGLKFSVHSKGKPLHKTNKKHGDISRWSPWDTPKWSSPKFFIGLTPSPSPPPKKKKTWHNISAYFSHWAPKHVSVWSFCRLACLDTLAQMQGGHRSWSTIVIGWFLSKHHCCSAGPRQLNQQWIGGKKPGGSVNVPC